VLVVPYLGSTVVGAMLSGQMARRRGRVKAIVLTGLSLVVLGFIALMLMSARTPLWVVLPFTFFLGVGTGMTMPTVLMQVQNAAERRDVGAATGSLLFLRSMGGAFGSTIVGTLLAMRFNAGLRAAGVTQEIDLGSLRGGSAAFDSLSAAAVATARAALAGGFRLGYAVCAVLLVLALFIALGMRDLPLRSSGEMPKELGH
jgi:MFS family permease